MKDVQKPDHASLNTIINRLKEGLYVIPDFQREFEWKHLQTIQKNSRSMYYKK